MILSYAKFNFSSIVQAKNLGNYHPTVKKLFSSSPSSVHLKRKRNRGLKMGVGKFSGGMLRLSGDEISAVQSRAGGSRGRRNNR
jgi:hypothetical protein